MTGPWRTVRVFVSSDYRDMRAEREVLETVVFPELRRRAAALGVEVVKVDPCFGASEEGAEGDDAIVRRLYDARGARYFIGLVGKRYGRVPGLMPARMLRLCPGLSVLGGRSFLEIETRLASLCPAPADQGVFFYLRSPLFLAEVAAELQAEYQAEDARAAVYMDALKRLLRASGRVAMDGYSCSWSAETKEIVGLEAFARQVTEDLWAAIARDFPPTAVEAPLDYDWPALRACADDEPDPPPVYVHENVQFTVYRPKMIEPGKWYPLLAFAHLEELPDDALPDEPDPVEEVKRQARHFLGAQADDYKESTKDSRAAVPREGEITFVPRVAGVVFNPPRRTFLFVENVHREEFRLRADAALDGQTAKGTLTVYLGSILLAEVPLSIRVESNSSAPREERPADRSSARPYRKIFASYSHKDLTVVVEFERYARTLGDCYLRDWVHLRAGEEWSDQLRQMIEEADVFQLFWSTNSMGSPFVEQEWRHALALGRANFVRPTYWEDPLPTSPARGLPPAELTRLHFHHFAPGAGSHPATHSELPGSPPEVTPCASSPPTYDRDRRSEMREPPIDTSPKLKPGRRRDSDRGWRAQTIDPDRPRAMRRSRRQGPIIATALALTAIFIVLAWLVYWLLP